MRLGEFVEAVASYGVQVSKQIVRRGELRLNYDYWETILGVMPADGSGHYRDYTPRMVRRMVAWHLVGEVTGMNTPGDMSVQGAPMRRHATRLLAAAPSGYVVMADGRAWWSYAEPVHALRTKCAVAVPVPQWRH